MGYAKYIGRVGALAVTLGVGVALASTAGVAYAEPSSSSSASDSSSTQSSGTRDAGSTDRAVDRDSSSPGDVDADGANSTDDDTGEEAEQGADDEDSASAPDAEPAREGDRRSSNRWTSMQTSKPSDGDGSGDGSGDSDESSVAVDAAQVTQSAVATPDVLTNAAVDTADALSVAVAVASAPAPPPRTEQRTAVVEVDSEAMSVGLQPLVDPVPQTPPVQAPMMLAALAAARDELERNSLRRNADVISRPAVSVLADDSPNVLLIGVDGANLSRVLADPANASFFSLIRSGTTAAASIAGHTTISNPSWSSILTGAWGETTGVINNVFTPRTYDRWPTVFNQLESFNSAIHTTAIANWEVIAAIAGAGAMPADDIRFVAQVDNDPNWLLTDDAVGDATEAAIAGADLSVPNFVFSYFVGVDENGHLYGGDSPEYAAALLNFDRNLGEILYAVSQSAEGWTIIMVTDHGHQPQKGLGHGFQSPDETSTFVIASNPDIFAPGAINLSYQIVDVTPTVVTLFGAPAADSDGVSLTDLDDRNVFPINDDEALRGALLDAIEMYGYPDIGTQLALGLRTIATSVPYFVFELTNQVTSALQGIADQDIFLISPLARLAVVPVQFIGDITYVATNFVAQIVARLTGVTGASIFPLWPPAPPSFPSTPDEVTMLDALPVCGDARGTSGAPWCAQGSIAV